MTDDDHDDEPERIKPPTDHDELVDDVQDAIGDGGVDPSDPRPEGHYPRFKDAPWYYVSEDLASTVMLGPATDAEPGDDWILSFTSEGETDEDRERICVRLTPAALHQLYIESKDLSPDARQAGHSAECGLCGEQVPLDEAWPDNRKEPCHPECYADAFGAPPWY